MFIKISDDDGKSTWIATEQVESFHTKKEDGGYTLEIVMISGSKRHYRYNSVEAAQASVWKIVEHKKIDTED